MTIVLPSEDSRAVAPLWFSARFSVDARFLEPGRELTIKVATSLGYPVADAVDIGRVVSDAMSRVLSAKEETLERIELTFRTTGESFEVTVVCDGTSYCHVTTALPGAEVQSEK